MDERWLIEAALTNHNGSSSGGYEAYTAATLHAHVRVIYNSFRWFIHPFGIPTTIRRAGIPVSDFRRVSLLSWRCQIEGEDDGRLFIDISALTSSYRIMYVATNQSIDPPSSLSFLLLIHMYIAYCVSQ
jgi:hypothetical protein